MADNNDLNINIGVNPSQAEAGSRRTKAALNSVTKESKEMDAALRRLKSSIDPTFAATEKYNRTLADNKKLLDAGRISQQEYAAGARAAKAALDQQVLSITRMGEASKATNAQMRADRQARSDAEKRAAAEELQALQLQTQQKIALAKAARREQELADRQRIQSLRLVAQAARQAAIEAERAARPVSARAVGRVAPGSVDSSRSIKQLENDIARAMGKLQRLAKEAEEAAFRAANSSSVKIAQVAEETAKRRMASAQEVRERIIQMERQLASQTGAEAQKAAQEIKAAKALEKKAVQEAAAAAKQAAQDKKRADAEAAASARQAARATEEQARAEARHAQELTELRSSIDPAYAAQTRYNETMRRATALLMQNKLAQGEWNRIQQQARAQMDVNVRSMGQMNSMYVQLGYQAQDVTASLASGINPLVILAQQGGQTAAALSTMGGKVGRVAAFMAGPWGAAIIGFTMLLGYLWDSTKDGEKATKDLMNAEDRRKMSVGELTDAVREYTQAQRDANEETLQGAVNQAYATAEARNRIFTEMAEAERRLADAQTALEMASNNPAAAEGMIGLQINVWRAQRAVDSLRKSYQDAMEAATEARAAYVQTTSEMTETEIREQMERTAALGAFRRDFQAAGRDTVKQAQVEERYRQRLLEIDTRYTALKEAEAAARRDNARAARDEEKAIFSSRQDAIGVAGRELRGQGYNVGENVQFGGVRGNHPGMGNTAHGQFAIDVNVPGVRNESADPAAKARMDAMVQAYRNRGFRILWNGKVYEPYSGPTYDIPPDQNQHRDHVHIEAPASIVGQPQGGGLAGQMAAERRELEEQAEQQRREAHIANIEFEQELERDNLQEVMRLQEEKIAALRLYYGEESEQVINAGREKIRIQRQIDRQELENQRNAIAQRLQLAETAAQAEADLAETARGAQGDVTDFAESNGLIDAETALEQKRAMLDREYQDQVAHENRMFNLRAQAIREQLALSNLPVEQRIQLNSQLEQLEAQHLATMGQLHANYNRGINQIQMQTASLSLQRWRDVAQTLTQSMNSAFQGMWMRSLSWQQALINIADQLVFKFADMGFQMLQDWIMRQIGMTAVQQAQEAARTGTVVAGQTAQTAAVTAATAVQTGVKATGVAVETTGIVATTAAHVAADATKTASTVASAGIQTAVTAATGKKDILTQAASAAASVYNSIAKIPVVGPFLAPAMAAGALFAVMKFTGLISARGGYGEVQGDDEPALLHKKEMVLPERFATPLRAALTARSSSGMIGAAAAAGNSVRNETTNNAGGPTFNYSPKANIQDASLGDMLRREGRTFRKWFYNEVRNGSLKIP